MLIYASFAWILGGNCGIVFCYFYFPLHVLCDFQHDEALIVYCQPLPHFQDFHIIAKFKLLEVQQFVVSLESIEQRTYLVLKVGHQKANGESLVARPFKSQWSTIVRHNNIPLYFRPNLKISFICLIFHKTFISIFKISKLF